jgi:hypothetical protein
LAALQVQRTAYGATEAARAAGRAYVTAPSTAVARQRAQAAALLALADQGVAAAGVHVVVTCDRPGCLSPGAHVRVTVRAAAVLPWVPSALAGPGSAVPVTATHVETVDPYDEARP